MAPTQATPRGDRNCSKELAEPPSGNPIEVGTGNMSVRETDHESADKRLQYSRFYNSNSTDKSGVGIGWLGTMDAKIVDIEALDYPPTPVPDSSSSSYSDPGSACTAGFEEIAARDPAAFAGFSAQYVSTGVNGFACEEFNSYNVEVGVIPVLNTNQSYGYSGAPTLVHVGWGVVRDDGAQYMFYCAQGACYSNSNVSIQLSVDASGNFTLIDDDGVTEHYDNTGTLLTRTWKDGYQLTIAHNGNDTVGSITDNHGRALALAYNTNATLASLTTPDGQVINYSQDSNGRLASVQYPTGTRTYQYTNASFPDALTGIVDEDSATNGGNPYVMWSYDANGNATSSAHAGGVNSVLRSTMPVRDNGSGSANASPIRRPRHDNAPIRSRIPAPQPVAFGISGPFCDSCGGGATNLYDTNGYLSQSTDWNGNTTSYTASTPAATASQYLRIDAPNTTTQRTTTTNWDPVLRNPLETTVVNASNATVAKTDWFYNAAGEPTAQCQEDPSVSGAMSYTCLSTGTVPAGVRRWTYTNSAAGSGCPLNRQLLTTTDPDGNVTTYSYYQTSASGCPTTCHYQVGDLQSVTNALGQVTTFPSYDGAGRVLSVLDVNNVETDFSYTARGWLQQVAKRVTNGTSGSGDQITLFGYDNVGQLTSITDPDAITTTFTYDAAHRLTDIADNLGDDIHYTLDNAGNRTQEDTKDPSGNLKHSIERLYNSLGQLQDVANAGVANPATNPTYAYTYDANGNPNQTTDGRGTSARPAWMRSTASSPRWAMPAPAISMRPPSSATTPSTAPPRSPTRRARTRATSSMA